MNDIVERLGKRVRRGRGSVGGWVPDPVSIEARDEIVRLRAERDRLRDALTPFARAALRLSSIGDERLLRITYDNGGVLAEVLPSEVRTAALLVKPHAALGDKP